MRGGASRWKGWLGVEAVCGRLVTTMAMRHIDAMKAKPVLDPKVAVTEGPVERGYASWKRAKVERGLVQAQDRDSMISVEQVLRDFGLER